MSGTAPSTIAEPDADRRRGAGDACPECGAPPTDYGCQWCAPWLVVDDAGERRKQALLADTLTIGRDSASDIVLPAPWVLEHHLRLERIGGAHRALAEGEAGRVLLRGKPIADEVLHDGDVLRVADPDTGGFVGLTYHNPLAPPIDPVQHFATPPGHPVLTIGRSAEADICLDRPLVCLHHADLVWRDGQHVLVDRASRQGTFVNGERIRGQRVLAPWDVVQIGTFRLTYDGDSMDSFDWRGIIRLDGRDLRRVVDAGGRDLTILHDTTISIEPCEFVGIVGGSGAGKSTLLMALSGFEPADHGSVHVNSDDLYSGFDAYRSIVGYVPQDDILHQTLTVERALQYAARLRLPTDTGEGEVARRIEAVLDEVEMTDHRTKRIDALSGGQRKRVSIASELLAEPPLLFLDEPTSGLDPGLERKMMYTLRRLADGGRTVVLITHATANILQCDHIAFMAAGRMVFFGPPLQALEFFRVDEFADIYTRTEGFADPESPLVRGELAAEWVAWAEEHPGGSPPPLAELWQRRFKTSLQHDKYAIERLGRAPEAPTAEQHAEKERRAKVYAQSRWQQLSILTRRYAELMRRDARYLLVLLAQAPVIAGLLLLVSPGGALTTDGPLEARKLLFMLATIGVWFGVINASREVCKETAITRRERMAGLHAGPYVASKVVVLFLLVLVQTGLLFGMMAVTVDFPSDGVLMPGLVEMYLTASLAGLAGIALGLCISVIASTPDKATSFIPIVLVPQVLFAGLMFKLKGVSEMLSWFTASRWAMGGMGASVDVNAMPTMLPLPKDPMYAATAENLLTSWGGLLAQSLVLLGIAWWVLNRRR